MPLKLEKKKKMFEDFLKENQVLIVDRISSSRVRLAKTLSVLGANATSLHLHSKIEEAQAVMEEKKPKLVLSDYKIGGGSGFDLFRDFRQKNPEAKDHVFVLVTSSTSQSTVAQAAEEDVDGYILKPYSAEGLEEGIIDAFITKLHPSKYMQEIEKGKDLLIRNEIHQAIQVLEDAMTMVKVPTLAYFYHGQAKLMLEEDAKAKDDYEKGLTYNSIHFKCLIGLFDILMAQEKFEEAYSVVKKIAKYFPANPERLGTVIRLAVQTENYEDMEKYYEIFLELEDRFEDAIRYVCAGLYICGKYLFMKGEKDKALKAFDKVAVSCEGRTHLLRAMIEVLVEHREYDKAKELLDRFPSDSKETDDFAVAEFLGKYAAESAEVIVQKGMTVINKKIKNFYTYFFIMKNLEKMGDTKNLAELRENAVVLFPAEMSKLKSA